MRPSSIVCASFVALAALATTVHDGSAASSLVIGSKETFKTETHQTGISSAGTTEADCTKNKGTITTNRDGTKTCILPAGTTTLNNSKSNSY